MPQRSNTSPAGISIVLPAHNESDLIGTCLRAVLTSHVEGPLECIVVANGCKDDTVARALECEAGFLNRGWLLTVLDLSGGGKLAALNAGDAAARHDVRVYLDADVVISPRLLEGIARVLAQPEPAYASGQCKMPKPDTWVTRAYRAFYRQVPFMTHGVPGCGLFAVNAAGRARWDTWPQIISDDTFARLSFAPYERHKIRAPYDWPLVEGFDALVRVRRRQNEGVDEIARDYPHLLENDDKPSFGFSGLITAILRAPLGFVVYAAVALKVRMAKGQSGEWSRGR